MTIDWTLPVETTEDPPRPVLVLTTDGPVDCPIVVFFGNKLFLFPANGDDKLTGVRLRNAAPAEPVKNCTTCRHCCWPCCELPLEDTRECSSSGLSKWESRHD